MDGTAFYVAITSMTLARTFDPAMDGPVFVSFFFARFFLALTGIGFIAMPSMFVAFGIPEMAIATMIGIEPILDMCGTAQSVSGTSPRRFWRSEARGRWTSEYTTAPLPDAVRK